MNQTTSGWFEDFIYENLISPPDAKSQLIEKDPDSGEDWGQEEKRAPEVEMVEWHHRLNGHESEQIPGVGDGQGSLICCSPWDRKESDTIEWLNNNEITVSEPKTIWWGGAAQCAGLECKLCTQAAWVLVLCLVAVFLGWVTLCPNCLIYKMQVLITYLGGCCGY